MSRIGESPINLPIGVTATVEQDLVKVVGPKGELTLSVRSEIKVEVQENQLLVSRKNKKDKLSHSLHGLTRTLVNNLVNGVSNGWEKRLELVGVGFRASTSGDKLSLAVGYSHPVEILAPDGVSFKVDENTKVTVTGIDKNLVGQVAANVRKVRPPEPYQGKGIRYAGEYVRRKAGKAGKVGAK